MSTPDQDLSRFSEADQAKLSSGDYVIDPVFGVQPKTVDIFVRDQEAVATQQDSVTTAAPAPAPAPTSKNAPNPAS